MVRPGKNDHIHIKFPILPVDRNKEKKEQVIADVMEKYGVERKNITFEFVNKKTDSNGQRVSLTAEHVENIQTPQYQQGLFKDYMEANEVKNISLEEICEIDNAINALIEWDKYSKYNEYKIKSIEWDNFLSYGPNNQFDFDGYKGLVLLDGDPENQCGKTTFAVDLLRFAFFGETDKAKKKSEVFNDYLPETTDLSVKVRLEINGEDYIVHRAQTRVALEKRNAKNENNIPQDPKFYKVASDGETVLEDYTGKNEDTNKAIVAMLGTKEDYDLIIYADQDNLSEILRTGQTEMTKLLSRWLGLASVEEKEKKAKEQYKEISKKLITGDIASLSDEVKALKEDLKTHTAELKRLEKDIADSDKTLTELRTKKEALLRDLKPIDKSVEGLQISSIDLSIADKDKELSTKKESLVQINSEYEKVKDIVYNKDEQDTVRERIKGGNKFKGEQEVLVKYYEKLNEGIRDLITKGVCPTCHQKVDVVEQEKLIAANDAEKARYQSILDKAQKKIEQLEADFDKMEKAKTDVSTKTNLETKISAVSAQIEILDKDIRELNNKKEKVKTNEENARQNEKFESEINNIKATITEETKVNTGLKNDRNDHKTGKAVCDRDIKTKSELIQTIKRDNAIRAKWELYIKMLGGNGIIKYVLRKTLPVINAEVARLLEGLVDFTIELGISDENATIMWFNRNGNRFKMEPSTKKLSGYERVMASLALRMALAFIGNMPKPNMLVLDEVIGPVGKENFERFRTLLERILENYDTILHVCHESTAVDWHPRTIMVRKENNISYIDV